MEPFCPEAESISAYLEDVQLFSAANGVETERQVPKLLSAIGRKVYDLPTDLLAHEKLTHKSLYELVTVLKSHYEPKPLVIAEVLRDCFVCDLRNEGTQKTEANLSLEKEVEMASGVEQL